MQQTRCNSEKNRFFAFFRNPWKTLSESSFINPFLHSTFTSYNQNTGHEKIRIIDQHNFNATLCKPDGIQST